MKPIVREDDKIDIEVGESVVVGKRLDIRRVLRILDLDSIDYTHSQAYLLCCLMIYVQFFERNPRPREARRLRGDVTLSKTFSKCRLGVKAWSLRSY